MFPKSFVDHLRASVRLSDVVGRRVTLKHKGREYGGLCPFHNEKTPSFTVNDEKGFFHCFGCGAHGDAIEFIKRYERMPYPEAIETLARESGVPLPERSAQAQQQYNYEELILKACEEATQWFEQQLRSTGGVAARQYIEKRRLTPATVQQFRLGYAPDNRDALKRALLEKGFSEKLLLDAGLIVHSESGSSYDRFRARLMFPIRNVTGKVVAFGGRLIAANPDEAARLPKYLNSAETPVFKKRSQLYNLDQAARAARQEGELLLVEGYMDVIACVQAGIQHTVAALGTAFTEEHAQLLWHYVDTPNLCLDGDAAGKRAMLKAAELVLPMLKPGKSLKFSLLAKGEDPDSYIQSHGAAAFHAKLQEAKGLHEVLWNVYSAQHRSDNPTIRANLEKRLSTLTQHIGDPTVKNHYREFFRKSLWGSGKKKQEAGSSKRSDQLNKMMAASEKTMSDHIVQQLLKLVLLKPALLHHPDVESALERLECTSLLCTQLKDRLLAAAHLPDAELQQQLQEIAAEPAAESLLYDKSILLPSGALEEETIARQCLEQWMDEYDTMQLETEFQSLSSQQLNEEQFQRMMALQAEIRERKRVNQLKYGT